MHQRKWKVTLPKPLPAANEVEIAIGFKNSKRARMEFTGRLPESVANHMMATAIGHRLNKDTGMPTLNPVFAFMAKSKENREIVESLLATHLANLPPNL